MVWNVSDAKNKLSELLDRACSDGPQTIERRGETYVVVIGPEYRKLTGQAVSLKDWLLSGPSLEGVDLERDRSPMREVEL